MSERLLILGRAGSGKTTLVLEEFCRYVRDKKVGARCNVPLLLVPTHSQAEHLKDVIIRKGLTRGFIDKSLFTFSQLARETLDLQGLRAPISEAEKELVLRHVLQRNPLGYLADAWQQQGLRFSLLRFFKELKEISLYPQDFRNKIIPFLEKVGARCNVPLPLREKCLSLVEAYSLFQTALEEKKLWDEDDLLNQALEALERDKKLLSEKELLLVDGFHDFTPVEFRILEALIQRVPKVYITLLFDPKDRNSPIFERCRDVYDHLVAQGFQERVLSGFKRSASITLQHIEKNLFTPPASTSEADDSLEIIEAVNAEDEVEQIARRIYQLVSKGGLRFNDICVIFRDITPYYDLIDTIFSQYNIPVRVYAKRPLMESPLVKAIVQLTSIFTSHWEDNTVLRTIKSPYLLLPTTEVDLLEYKALEKGKLCTKRAWLALAQEGPWPKIRGLFERLAEIEKDISVPKPPPALREWLLRLIDGFITLPGVTDRFAALTTSQGQRALIKQESEALGSFLSLLDSHTRLAGREPLHFSTFWEGFLSTLSASSYAQKDKRYEVVNVIDALEARQWELSVVFVGGLLERQFPRQGGENLFLKDRERRLLRSLTGINLQEILKRTREEERFLFYVALTRAKTKLILSYPATDSRGIPNLPSFFLMEVEKLFSPKSFKEVSSRRTPSHVIPKPEDFLTSEDLGRFLFYYLGSPYRKGSEKEHLHYLSRWLYNRLLKETSPWLEDLKVALESPEKGDISPYGDILKEIMPSYSATQLRDYAQCPYLHFCKHILRLEPLPSLVETGLDAPLQGGIIHEALRIYYSEDSRDIESIFQETFHKKTRGIPLGFRELRLMQEMLQSLKALLELDKSYAALLPLRPRYLEKTFGQGEIPALELQDRDLGTVRVTGRIDRIDVAEIEGEGLALVIDYKYSKYNLNGIRLKDIEEGRDLQLPIYLMAAKECLNLRPLGAQFFYMKPPGRSGILNCNLFNPSPLDKKGMHFTDEKGLEVLLETSREHLLRHIKGILSGNKSIAPWDTQNCVEGRCDFRDVCRFEKWSSQKRTQ